MIFRNHWLQFIIFLGVLLVLVHRFAMIHFWYWQWKWFDVPMHILGGLLAGAVGLGLISYFYREALVVKTPGWWVWTSIICALIIGGLWEFFEFAIDRTILAEAQVHWHLFIGTWGGWRDSIKDLVDDVLGGILAGITFFKLWKPNQ